MLIAEKGLTALTVEGVAARAKVGKPTIYRHFANRFELAMTALMASVPMELAGDPGQGSALARLEAQLRQIAALFASPSGRHVASILASSERESEIGKAFRSHFVETRRLEGRAILADAIAAGEVRADLDLDLALDLVYGPLFYRLAMRHVPLGRDFVDGLLRDLLRGFAPAPPPARGF